MTARVYIAQLKCPANHCVLAAGAVCDSPEAVDALAAFVREKFAELSATHINPWCGLCKSRELHVDLQRTEWRSIEDAAPVLKELEREQAYTRAFFERSRN